MRNGFAVMTVQHETKVDIFPVGTRNLQRVATPPLVGRGAHDTPCVCTATPSPSCSWEVPGIDLHQAPNALAIVCRAIRAIDQRDHAAIAVSATLPNDLADLRGDRAIIGAPVVCRTPLRRAVRRRPADLQGAADGRNGMLGHFLTTPYQWGFFLISSRAASKISTSIVLRPRARSNSLIRCLAALSSDTGTNSSSA